MDHDHFKKDFMFETQRLCPLLQEYSKDFVFENKMDLDSFSFVLFICG